MIGNTPRPEPPKTYLYMGPRRSNVPVVSAAIGRVLAEQRKSVELTRTAPAGRAGLRYKQFSALERGSGQATICEFLSLGEALGADPRELFNRVLTRLRYSVGYRPVRTT
jgi:hypothetical protein